MTFQEAVEFKRKLIYTKYHKDGYLFHVFVTPFEQNDLSDYFHSLR
jgi:hypothetical protein